MADREAPAPSGRQRLDRWLFFSRAVKSRTLAQKVIETGAVRINAERTLASDARIGAGDVLTMTINSRLLVWRVRDPGTRRGPAPEAALLYEDLSPPPLPRSTPPMLAARDAGAGRPTKKERRDIGRFTDDHDADAGD